MTGEPTRADAVAATPGLTLREAVRPVAFAYALLSAQQDRAVALADQAEQLVQHTRGFLEAAGQAHLLGESPATATPVTDPRTSLVQAYASAALHWAQVLGSAVELGKGLIADRQWDRVQQLVSALRGAGEADSATELHEAMMAELKAMLAPIRDEMAEDEIAQALETAECVFQAFQSYAPDAMGILPDPAESINKAIVKYGLGDHWGSNYRRMYWGDPQKPKAEILARNIDQLKNYFAYHRGRRREGII